MTAILSLTVFVKVFGLVRQGGPIQECRAKARFTPQVLLLLLSQ